MHYMHVAGRLAVLLCATASSGCGGAGCEVVPVSGKLTYGGGSWPAEGVLFFSPLAAAEGLPLTPAVALVGTDGRFVVRTNTRQGLVPGKYRVAVQCWQIPPGHEGAGKSYVPAQFMDPRTSGLVLTVEPGSGALEPTYDIPRSP